MSRVIESGYTLAQAKNSVGKGWHILLELGFREKPEDVKVVQVKEKFGGLRFYWDVGKAYSHPTDPTHAAFQGVVYAIEALSYKLCELCGSQKDVTTEPYPDRGYIFTRCKACRVNTKY